MSADAANIAPAHDETVLQDPEASVSSLFTPLSTSYQSSARSSPFLASTIAGQYGISEDCLSLDVYQDGQESQYMKKDVQGHESEIRPESIQEGSGSGIL